MLLMRKRFLASSKIRFGEQWFLCIPCKIAQLEVAPQLLHGMTGKTRIQVLAQTPKACRYTIPNYLLTNESRIRFLSTCFR